MEFFTYQSKYYHNEHSKQRDRFLISQFGKEWLTEMKNKGYFNGDFPEEMVGKLKEGDYRSKSFDKNGNEVFNKEINLDASSN